MDRMISISEAGKILGVTTQTPKTNLVTCFSAKVYASRDGIKIKKTFEEVEKERRVNKDNENNNASSFD